MAGLNWVRAADCESGTCVEAAAEYDFVLVRNSEIPLEIVRFTKSEWSAFTNGVKCGDFDAVDLGGPV